MAAAGDNAPIIVIKKVKKGGHGHHGGAWKVAYADFVTAMMAFFLLLWLLNATTDEQKQGIADYFTPASVSKNFSGSGGVMGGKTMSKEGVMARDRSAVNVTVSIPADSPVNEPEDQQEKSQDQQSEARLGDRNESQSAVVDREQMEELMAMEEQEQLEAAEEELRQALDSVPQLQELKENLIIEQTPEGLRIQIVDQDKRSMFPLGSAEMFDHTRQLMEMVVGAIRDLPQRIAIKGHTDATPYSTDQGYSNWELSTDRANASRRALIAGGLPAERIQSVSGRADQEPLIAEDPFSAQNRRISITLLRERKAPLALGGEGDVEVESETAGERDAAVPAPDVEPSVLLDER